ncbi:MAG: S9 family peptidase [Candidatus Delongbacteria bacterium]|nr:S9 family peptidase [Candidatus Delongbacteria bacterium]
MKFRHIIFLLTALIHISVYAETYKLPPKAILDVFDAPDPELITLIEGTDKAIQYTYQRYESLESLSSEKLSLAGQVILPSLHSEKTSYPRTYLKMVDLNTMSKTDLNDPQDDIIIKFEISPDRKYIAYLAQKMDGIYLRVVDLHKAEVIFRDEKKVNMALENLLIKWSVDSKYLIIPRIHYGNDPIPEKQVSDIMPKTEESFDKTSPLRTYSNLLETAFDMKLFEYFFTSRFVMLDFITGKETPVGEPGIYRTFSQSPNGKYFLTRKVNEPYSYTVPYYRFGYSVLILDEKGNVVTELVNKPIQDEIPIGGVETGVRWPAWIPTEPSTVWWTEALDGGDPKVKVPFRDKFYKLDSPFKGKPELFLKTKNRGYISGFSNEKGKMFYLDYDRDNEWMSTYYGSYDGSVPDKMLFTRNEKEKYEHPGDLLTERLPNGYEVIKTVDGHIYLYGQGYSPEGNFPFLNRFSLETGETETLFKCAEESYENFSGFIGTGTEKICVTRETPEEPRNYYVQDLKTSERTQITSNYDHAPVVRDIKTELISYLREDSVTLSGKLYLPPDFTKGKRYPLVIWAYPREFTELSTAAQITGSNYTFTRFWGASVKYLALHGYVVLDGASMPVVGDRETRNDTFTSQIRLNAKAAIDHLDSLGMIDREKVAVGGHSYGAFMTANLLAYTDLFKAGIANSGAYNRTLTPFGFQSEERTYWEAKEFYQKASPFMNAEMIKTPLLLIHGMDDDNPGTYPMQSERMYAAIKGVGGSARLVMLPYEGHSYHSKESNLHVLAEMCDWLDRFLK